MLGTAMVVIYLCIGLLFSIVCEVIEEASNKIDELCNTLLLRTAFHLIMTSCWLPIVILVVTDGKEK